MAICIETSARLHLGFYNFFEDGIAYGGLGVAIEYPKIRVKVYRDTGFSVINKVHGLYVDDVVDLVKNSLNVSSIGIVVEEAYSRHVGLGSTTQLALSISYGIAKLLDMKYSVRELAVALGRGRDSGIGVATFEYGGFVVDSGRRVNQRVEVPRSVNDIPQILFRSYLPEDWYFIVIIPHGIKGLDEVRERSVMDYPQPLPRDLQYELYKLLLLHIIPSIVRRDIEVFGKAITKLQRIVGEYFSKYQGGIYCCREAEEIVNALLNSGAQGAGQSSWGPTVYGIISGKDNAFRVLRKVSEKIERHGIEYSYYVVKNRAKGASINIC
ncbi:MAG: hypothetical protein QXI86_00065 [Ignisphaera sp.]